MRIVFVAPFGLGQKTTVWARTLPLARHLAGRGCQVTLLIPPWDTPSDAGRVWDDGGVRLINVALGGGLPLITARLLREIDRLQPDIVHLVKPRAYAGIVGWLLWQRRRWARRGPRLLLDVDDLGSGVVADRRLRMACGALFGSARALGHHPRRRHQRRQPLARSKSGRDVTRDAAALSAQWDCAPRRGRASAPYAVNANGAAL